MNRYTRSANFIEGWEMAQAFIAWILSIITIISVVWSISK